MALTLRGQTDTDLQGAGQTDHVVTKPLGVLAGDAIVYFCLFYGLSGGVTPPAGFTATGPLAAAGGGEVYAIRKNSAVTADLKVAQGGSVDTVTLTTVNSVQSFNKALAWAGASGPWDVDVESVTDATSDTAIDVPAATAQTVDDVDLWLAGTIQPAGAGQTAWTLPAGYTALTNLSEGDGGQAKHLGGFYKIGSLGDVDLEATSFTTDIAEQSGVIRVVLSETPLEGQGPARGGMASCLLPAAIC